MTVDKEGAAIAEAVGSKSTSDSDVDVAAERLGRQLAMTVREAVLSGIDADKVIRNQRDRIQDLNEELDAREERHRKDIELLTANERQLMDALAAARAQTNALLSSTSWKVSAPIRILARGVGKAKRLALASRPSRPSMSHTLDADLQRLDPDPGVRDAWELLVHNS